MGVTVFIIAAVVGVIAFAAGYLTYRFRGETILRSATEEAERLIEEAQTRQKEILLEAKTEAIAAREEAEAGDKAQRQRLRQQERKLQRRREALDRRFDNLERRTHKLEAREKQLAQAEARLEGLRKRQLQELQRVSELSKEEARDLLLKAIEQETRQDAARVIRQVEAETKEEAETRAREIIATAIQRVASDQVTEATVSTVPLPNDEMKGRIIGRNGRNIRAIENVTGVDIIVDDTPEAITLSCFDPVRREIARLALTKLVLDGRIHPARIESVVKKTQEEVERIIREEGERAAQEAGVHGLHRELIRLIGRLKYRTSYGQNVLSHVVETAHLARMIADELGADSEVVRKGALLHDIGKAVSHEVDGAHAAIGAEYAKRYGMPSNIVNCVAAHHGEEEPASIEAIIVEAADAISGARPGARRETLESYLKRIKALETVAESFDGVAESYAIQAGREIRIMVKPQDIDDLAATRLSRDIAKKVEETLQYPGQIKVTVIRETRAVDYAR